MPVRDLPAQPLDDSEAVYYGSRAGDAMLLALVVGVLLINGVILWRQLGPARITCATPVFFGLLLLSAYWAALVYTFKLSVSARIGPHGLAVVRGPWRTELAWREVDRLVERAQASQGTRYRWVIAYARDGRQLSIREDMVANYARFRFEVYERYRLYQDHGGTWATGGAGPFSGARSHLQHDGLVAGARRTRRAAGPLLLAAAAQRDGAPGADPPRDSRGLRGARAARGAAPPDLYGGLEVARRQPPDAHAAPLLARRLAR